jgi:hypothetical protein
MAERLLRGVPEAFASLLKSECPEVFTEKGADRYLEFLEMYSGQAKLTAGFRRAASLHVVFCRSLRNKVMWDVCMCMSVEIHPS